MINTIFIAVLPAAVFAADIHLSPSGPVSTPLAARDAARAAAKPARIVVADGVYPLTAALELDDKDSLTSWEAAQGAKPVFEGGRAIAGWQKAGGGQWKAVISDKSWFF